MPPRAAFTSSTPGFTFAKALRPSMPTVSFVRGTCTVRMSERASSSSKGSASTSSFAAAWLGRKGS